MKHTTAVLSRARARLLGASLAFVSLLPLPTLAEGLTLLHIGDQESWLLSAQGNLRDDASQAISFYGGIDRLAATLATARNAALSSGRSVVTLNTGDAFLPGPRFTASFANLSTAYSDGGQDFYDAIALRTIGFDAVVFGNHEFDLGPDVAARFVEVSETTYLSSNLDFSATPAFSALAAAGKVAPFKVVTTAGGKKIALVGATTPLLPTISSPAPVPVIGYSAANTELQNLNALVPIIQASVDTVRAQGANTIILLSHLQNWNNERTVVIPQLRGVDVVLSGGGHELMGDVGDLLLPGDTRAITGMPQFVNDADGKAVAVLTSNFGNRYVGELNLTIDDVTGAVVSVDSSRLLRVTGAAADADRVIPDASLNASIVAPIRAYIQALNAQIIGTTALRLNGDRGTAGTPGNYVPGLRNAETNLGNLVADALRFSAVTDVAVQNGGGVRASIAGPGNVSVGDTFNVLPFTNLVRAARSVSAAQLKQVLESAFAGANTNPSGGQEGRFPQISGMKVFYKSNDPAGSRVKRIVLDDGTVLVDAGAVVNATRRFSLATIDFLAAGGDSYAFPAAGVAFENAVNTVTYQEALLDLIQTEKSLGGLARLNAADGDEITANAYGAENPFDLHGRTIDLAVAVAVAGNAIAGTAGRDTLVGTAGDDIITGGAAGDSITGGKGGDTLVYSTLRDLGDTITDFTPYADRIDATGLLTSIGAPAGTAFSAGYLRFIDVIGGTQVLIDTDGSAGPAAARVLATLKGLTAAQLAPARDFVF